MDVVEERRTEAQEKKLTPGNDIPLPLFLCLCKALLGLHRQLYKQRVLSCHEQRNMVAEDGTFGEFLFGEESALLILLR